MPLANTKVIDPRFEEHHRPVAEGQMTGTCRIERPSPDPPTWDDVAGRDVYPPPELLYDGSCRYQYLSLAGQPIVADAPTPLADVRITVPAGAVEYQVNDVVTMTGSPKNPDIADREMTAQAVSASSISWQRDLTCQLRQPTTR